jgi:hypothetical protein
MAAKCKSCGALIEWIVTEKGKRSPINLDGVSHWSTCPDAKTWKKQGVKNDLSKTDR